MIESSLSWLIWILFRGGLRRVWRQLKTPSGFILSVVVLGFLSFAVGPSLVLHYLTADTKVHEVHHVRSVLPLAIFALAVLNLFTDAGKQAMELSPPELQFDLVGPYSDRQILTYRLSSLFIAWLPTSMFIGMTLIMFTGSWFTTFVCIYLSGMLAMLGVSSRRSSPRARLFWVEPQNFISHQLA